IIHQRSAHARTPRVAHTSVYSRMASAAPRGIAPSELEIRYVVDSRIGNSARYWSSGSIIDSSNSHENTKPRNRQLVFRGFVVSWPSRPVGGGQDQEIRASADDRDARFVHPPRRDDGERERNEAQDGHGGAAGRPQRERRTV